MTTTVLSYQPLARRLLASQVGLRGEALGAPEAAERIFRAVGRRVARLVTETGSEALLTRAVQLSHMAFPFLDRASLTFGQGSLIRRLRESAVGVESNQAREGFATVLGNLILLLVTFIGRDRTGDTLRSI